MDQSAPEKLKKLLRRHPDLEHLEVAKRGDSLSVVSHDQFGTAKHARFTFLGGGQWGLSLPRHTGKWEPTPFVGSLQSLVDDLVTNFRFYLEQH